LPLPHIADAAADALQATCTTAPAACAVRTFL
jgi:hypothetical protein